MWFSEDCSILHASARYMFYTNRRVHGSACSQDGVHWRYRNHPERWTCGKRLDLGPDRLIDASVIALAQGGYRLFFNEERMGKAILTADSADPVHWPVKNRPTTMPGEDPKAFC